MAGTGIRCWELAKVLAGRHTVTIAATQVAPEFTRETSDVHGIQVLGAPVSAVRLAGMVANHDIVYLQGQSHTWVPLSLLRQPGKHVVVDLTCPFPLEDLAVAATPLGAGEAGVFQATLAGLRRQLLLGDFFLAAHERQRDFWLGMLLALGRIQPAVARHDSALEQLITVVPYGVPSQPPRRIGPGLRDTVPSIGPHDQVLYLGGGLHPWLDLGTPLRAMAMLAVRHPEVKLVFLAPAVSSRPAGKVATERALGLAHSLGVLDRSVFAHREWVPYAQRADYLLDAAAGLSCHPPTLETRFSFRIRVLDYLWAGLPVITTEGDYFAELVTTKRLGLVVPPGEPQALARAIVDVLAKTSGDKALASRMRSVATNFQWLRVAQPLLDYCDSPQQAADKFTPAWQRSVGSLPASLPPIRPWRMLQQAIHSLRETGTSATYRRTRRWLSQRLGAGRDR